MITADEVSEKIYRLDDPKFDEKFEEVLLPKFLGKGQLRYLKGGAGILVSVIEIRQAFNVDDIGSVIHQLQRRGFGTKVDSYSLPESLQMLEITLPQRR